MRKTAFILLSIYLLLLITGCGMSDKEKQKDLENKMATLKIAVGMYIDRKT
ncbi:hypothetical protein [Pectinatus haikarae]|uniref:hypothetical protein n=1 Tax=Pectinatus haikarae TaxID=349096 RepID=UPI0018C5E390|nr:hypothetical protein [Pectinatus haikarae]